MHRKKVLIFRKLNPKKVTIVFTHPLFYLLLRIGHIELIYLVRELHSAGSPV